MKTKERIIMIVSLVLIFSYTVSFASKDEQPNYINDLANIIETKDEEQIYLYAEKLDLQTNTKLYIKTLENEAGNNVELDKDILKNKNSIIINYYKDTETIEIKPGENASNTITTDIISGIKANDIVQGNIKANSSNGVRYLYLKVADEIFVANGFESIIKTEEALEQNKNSKKAFYIVVAIAILCALFFTPISPYQKRKKNAKSIYAPPNPNGGGFYGGGQTLGGDFTGTENKNK